MGVEYTFVKEGAAAVEAYRFLLPRGWIHTPSDCLWFGWFDVLFIFVNYSNYYFCVILYTFNQKQILIYTVSIGKNRFRTYRSFVQGVQLYV